MQIIQQLAELGIHIKDATTHTRTLCPKCSSTRKKYYVQDLSVEPSITGAKFYCQHCGYSGVIGDAAPAERRTTFKKPDYQADGALNPKVVEWFKGRGISESVLTRNKIGYKKEDDKPGSMTFPYYRGGEVINVKYRTHDKQFRLEGGAELCLYGLDDIAGDTLYWVEGEIDKLSLEMAGITSCVSVPNGAPPANAKNVDRHLSYLETVDLSNITKHVIAVDADAPGEQLKSELVKRLGVEKCYFVSWPEGSKDANDLLQKRGIEVLREFALNPIPFPIEDVVSANDVLDKLGELYTNGRAQALLPGTPSLYAKYTVRPGQMTIVTGIPSHGKSSWVDWVCYTLARSDGWKFGVFSPENWPIEEHTRKFVEMHTGKPFEGLGRMTEAEMVSASTWIDSHFHFIHPENRKVEHILSRARALITRHGINGLIIDPWNTLDPSRDKGMSETEHVSQTLLKIHAFAEKNNIHIWVVAHPTKLKNVEATGDEPVPTLYDIAGSRAFYERADFGITIWRNKNKTEMPVQVHVKKVRFKQYGEEGMIEMGFDRKTNRYSDYAEPEGDF